jgi:hypothetical protein
MVARLLRKQRNGREEVWILLFFGRINTCPLLLGSYRIPISFCHLGEEQRDLIKSSE